MIVLISRFIIFVGPLVRQGDQALKTYKYQSSYLSRIGKQRDSRREIFRQHTYNVLGLYHSAVQSILLISNGSADESDLTSDGELSGASFVDEIVIWFSFWGEKSRGFFSQG